MNQSDAEVSQLAREATELFNRNAALNTEAGRLAVAATAAFKAGRRKEGDNLLDEAKRLMKDATELKEQGEKLLAQSNELASRVDVGEPSPNYVTCRCQHCDTGIEFDAAELVEENNIVPCPHCGLETKLFVPPTSRPQKAETPIPTQAELNALAKKNAQLEEIKGFLKK